MFAPGGITRALSATRTAASATLFHTLSAAAFTLTERRHATVSGELSVTLPSDTVQSASHGLHGLAHAVQRGKGLLTVTAAITIGWIGRIGFGTGIAVTCMIQCRLDRDHLTESHCQWLQLL
ncbi:hypothetical protein [Streptomyces sp. SID12488]|uniref:hypothetical protein n=1 Tax=Streptomyces sp. SID12488 TaxID=2706040 RepID=UPI0013D98D3F|nr:hypothetical protein [Streptomyces sp. SID12488]NEA62903.1 hypothetical protein [Streptomyces sp. SID12488]